MNTIITSDITQNTMSTSRLCALGATIAGKKYVAWRANQEKLLAPLRWRRARHIELRSDLFHENVTDEMRDHIFAVMALCPQHTFQVLTKRPERMLKYLQRLLIPERVHRIARAAEVICKGGPWTPEWLSRYAYQPGFDSSRFIPPLPNVWLGVSVENQKTADERIPLLLQTPAAIRFISAEPLLSEVRLLWKWVSRGKPFGGGPQINALRPWEEPVDLPGVDWVIVGGESGHGARPMNPDWARLLRDQCLAAGVPYFFRQYGAWAPVPLETVAPPNTLYWMDEHNLLRLVGAKAAGHLLDGKEWHQFPEVKS